MNVHSETDRVQTMLACCYSAVQTGFRHIAVRNIIDPPHQWFDAALARQIAIHILARQFDVPRRRIVTMQARQRTSITYAIRTVDRRLQDACFRAAYRRMAKLALDLYAHEYEKAAA